MENKILNLLKKIIKEDEDTFIDITDMDDDSAAETVISKKDIFKKLRDKMSDKDRTPAGFEYGEIVSGEMGENEMEEGNAFSGALAKAKEDGKSSFEVDGKTYQVKEAKEEKFIQKATKKMEKKGTSGKFGEWCKSHGLDKNGEVTKKCIDKAMKSDDSKVVKMANFAKNIGGFKGAKHESVKEKVVFTEAELIDFIERIVEAEKVVDKGFKTAMNTTKKENTDAIKQVASKMKDYMKNMGTDYEENPKSFPKGNKIMSREDFGKEVSDDKKKAYKASDAVEEYIDAFAYPGQTNLVFDEIKPDDTKIEKYLKGHSTTGNAQVDEDGNGLGNVVPSEVGEKFYKNYEENLYGAEQMDASYKRQPAPVDVAGDETTEGDMKTLKSVKKSQKIFDKLGESIEDKKVISDMEKMKKLIGYNQKTQ